MAERDQPRGEAGPAPAVVLLHGLGRSPANMAVLQWRLSRRGFETHNLRYPWRSASIEAAAEAVARRIAERVPADRTLHFVTHSLGGLVLRALLAAHPRDGLGRAVLLAPPNRGSELADRLRGWPGSEWLLGPLAGQLGTGEGDLPQRLPEPSIPYGVIAGDRWLNPLGAWWLAGPHDGTVRVERTRLPGMRDHLVMPHTHTFIMNASRVAEQVEAFLRHGRFRRPADERDAPVSVDPSGAKDEPRMPR